MRTHSLPQLFQYTARSQLLAGDSREYELGRTRSPRHLGRRPIFLAIHSFPILAFFVAVRFLSLFGAGCEQAMQMPKAEAEQMVAIKEDSGILMWIVQPQLQAKQQKVGHARVRQATDPQLHTTWLLSLEGHHAEVAAHVRSFCCGDFHRGASAHDQGCAQANKRSAWQG
jgi:hypothetical protein